jgi:hypothetical protein
LSEPEQADCSGVTWLTDSGAKGLKMNTTTVLSDDTAVLVTEERHFNWGAAIAGAVAATATSFFLLTLGSGVGLALASPQHGATLLTLGAIYFFAAQAFGFTVGGYLVGRLIGPEVETPKEEEFRAAAHGFVMWALTIVAGLLIVGLSSVVASSTLYSGAAARTAATPAGYWEDALFRPATNSPTVLADKAEAGRILTMDMATAGGTNDADTSAIARLVAADSGVSMTAAMNRVADVEVQMRQQADTARKAASIISLWTAFALLFGAIVAVAAAISSRWMDDKISFSMAPRRK